MKEKKKKGGEKEMRRRGWNKIGFFFPPPPPPLSSRIFENGENKKEGKRGCQVQMLSVSFPPSVGLCDKLLSLFMFRDSMVERTSALYLQ